MRHFISRHHNKIGLAVLGSLFLTETVGAAGGGLPANPPEWAVYLGLMAICPKDVNEYLRKRMGLGEE